MVTHGWFVCPTVSMVTISHATGLKKTLLSSAHSLTVIYHIGLTYKEQTIAGLWTRCSPGEVH